MIEFFLINQIFILLIDIIGIWLAFWIYLGNRKAKVNQLFFPMTIFILLWINFAYLAHLPSQFQSALLWRRLAFGASSFFFIPAYFFAVYFPKTGKRFPIIDKIVISIGIFFSFISIFTDLIIKDMQVKEWGTDVILGKGIIYLYGAIIFFTFIIISQLIMKYFEASEEEKVRIQYFLIGAFLFTFMNLIFNVILPFYRKSFHYYQFGDYSTILFLGFVTYAIVKRELFGIRVVVASIFVVLIAILLALDALLFTQVLAIQALKGIALAIFIVFGWMLIKSVSEEVKRREELEKLNRAKSEFISMASHQLRTPLTAIKGYSSLMTEGTYGKVDPKCDRVLRNIFISTERLIKIVNDLLNLSRVDLGKLELDKKPTKIEKLVEEVYQEVKPLAKTKNLEFVLEKPEKSLPELNVDPLKIRQVISNLVDNAIKYTDKGKVSIKIERIRSRVRITISDTGRGFSEEEKSKLFQLFVRGEAGIDSFIEGTGIGLSVAKKFIELHKGTIYADSPGKGKGAIFWFELPIERENSKLLDYLSQE